MILFQRALRPYRPDRDGLLLSNTWGGGNGDSRICERFLLGEIEAGARIGVDVIQIDDGWEHGRTTTSRRKALAGRKKVWNGYWAEDPDFWKPDEERFPNGLSGLVRKAAEKGMRFGLWFGPDSSNDAANWEKDAHCLLDFHRRLGIDYFKMDSMKSHTQLALNRNRKMFDALLRDSNGKMVTRTRQVRKTRWYPASGTVHNSFHNLLVPASRGATDALLRELEPWDLSELIEYRDEFIKGYRQEAYAISLADGFQRAGSQMEPVIDNTICKDIGGDEQRIHERDISYYETMWKHIVLPVYLSSLRYNGKSYHFLINARTGEVQGERPYSGWKIFFFILFLAAIIGVIVYFFTRN